MVTLFSLFSTMCELGVVIAHSLLEESDIVPLLSRKFKIRCKYLVLLENLFFVSELHLEYSAPQLKHFTCTSTAAPYTRLSTVTFSAKKITVLHLLSLNSHNVYYTIECRQIKRWIVCVWDDSYYLFLRTLCSRRTPSIRMTMAQ